jgi:hypothetical protein
MVATTSFSNSPSIYVAAGAQLTYTSGIGWFSIGKGQTLWGNGLLAGGLLTFATGATLVPGSNSPGVLNVSGRLVLAAGCTNIFEVSHSPFTNDTVIVSGALTNGGTLIISNAGGTFAAGDTFKLFNAGSYNGAFASVQLPPLPFGLAWSTNDLNTSGVISVMLNTTPVINSVSLSGNSLWLSGAGGVGNASFVLLSGTNLAVPLTGWIPVLTNQFDSGGNFSLTNTVDAEAPQSFYLLKMQ